MSACMNYVWIKGFVRSWLIVVVGFMAGTALAATGTWTGGAGATWDTSFNNWSGVTHPAWDVANGTNNAAVTANRKTGFLGGMTAPEAHEKEITS